MIKKLLNKKFNLIIVIITLCLILLAIPTIVLATATSLSDYLKETIAMWYVFIKSICIAVMFIGLLALGIKAAFSNVAEEKSNFKKMLVFWIIGIILLFSLENIIYGIINLEQTIVHNLKEMGLDIVNDSPDDQSTAEHEISLYESARTKAYEIKFSSGMLGLFMYIVLVYYTFKFFIIYVKRYLNVMILILVGPIVITVYSFRRAFQGKGGIIGRWVKELLYNVFIQVVHAATYTIVVGYSLRLSDNVLSFLGAIITFLAFFFMSKLDGMIRKIFNFIGGKSTVKVRDYASIVKHPIDSFNDSKGYITETLPQEIQGKAENLAEKFTPENLAIGTAKFANNFANKTQETMEALDGKRVKVSAEAIKREQEKIDNPNIIQKVFNTVQSVALGVTEGAITGTEKLINKTKEQIKKINEATKDSRKELNQDFEMIKRFAKILKFHARRKRIENPENKEEQLPEEQLQATVIDVLDNPEAEVLELKESIKSNFDDIVAIVYGIQGPAVFIYPEIGSGYMGMSVLSTAKYEEHAIQVVSDSDKKIILFPHRQLSNSEEQNENEKIDSIEGVKRRYKFKRFNHTSVATITRSLNRRYVMNSQYLSNLYQVNQMIVNGGVQVSGRYSTKGYSQIRRSSIKYTAKLKSHDEKQSVANITFGRYTPSEVREEKLDEQNGKIIYFNSVKQRKQRAQQEVQTYQSRVQDSNWAVLESSATDVKAEHEQRIIQSTQAIRQQSSTEVVLQQLSDMGKVIKMNSDMYVAFEDKSIDETINEIKGIDSEDNTIQIITDSSIIDAAIKFDISLEEIDLTTDEDIQEDVLDTLVKKGVVSFTVKSDEEQKELVIEALEERKNYILNNQKQNYVKSVMQRTAAKMFINAVDAADTVTDKAKDFGSQVYNSAMNNKYTNLLGQIAKGAVETEAERVKRELIDQVQAAVDATKEYVEAGEKLYGISVDDFKRKGEAIKTDIREGSRNFAIGVEEKAESAVKAAAHALNPFSSDSEKNNKDEYDRDDTFIFYILGAVVLEGRYELPIGSRVYDAIKAAGGPTEEADLTAIPYYEPIRNGETIYIPKRSSDDIEKVLEECRPVVEEVIKDYLVENNISNVEALRKLVHKKTILSKVQRKLSGKNITTSQVEGLIEKRIKELKYIRDELNDASRKMKVIDKAEVVVQETENVQKERERQERGAKNSEETSLDEALKKLHSLSDTENGNGDETDNKGLEEQSQDDIMNNLLSQLEEQKEKVLVSAKNSERGKNVNRMEFEQNPGKQRAREEFTNDPDKMMNKILGRI